MEINPDDNRIEINPDDLAGLDLFQNCRLCLAKDKVSIDIFNEEAEIRQLYYKIISCLPIQVTQEDDKLPKKICVTCNEKVDTFYQFWTLTAKTQKTLFDWVHKKDSITTKIKTENVPPGEMSFKQEIVYSDDNDDDLVEPLSIVKVCEDIDETEPSETDLIKSKNTEPPEENHKPFNLKKSKNEDLSINLWIRHPKSQSDGNSRDKLLCKKCGKNHSSNEDCSFKPESENQRTINFKKSFSCHVCPASFTEKRKLERHMVVHSNERPFPCSLCDKFFKTEYSVTMHMKYTHIGVKRKENKLYKCTVCQKEFARQKNLDDHQYVHTGVKNYSCDICGFQLASAQGFANHKVVMHGPKTDDTQNNFVCHVCGKAFSTYTGRNVHIKVKHEDGRVECHICGKKLSNKVVLKTHINMHLGNKAHSCDICGHRFTAGKYLKVHMRSHTGETPHSCNMCSRSFTQRSALTRHIKRIHPYYVPA